MDPIEELITRRVQQILPTKAGLYAILRSHKIRLYQGFDPSSPNLHIGHLVGLLQLKMFQDLGHEVIFLIGDFTGMIGDPTDKTSARTKLTPEQVAANAETYKAQAGKNLRFEGDNAAQIKFNSAWLNQLNLTELIELSSAFTIQQLIERDMFQDRLKQNKPIYLHEFLYPLMVTYDAIAMGVDLEIGGNDQLFNMTVGRPLIMQKTNKDKYAMTMKLLTDKDGRKIGKTTGNAINLFGDPKDLYGQIMALPDETIVDAFLLATNLPLEEVDKIKLAISNDPMAQKKRLAFEIVKLCHSLETAEGAQAHFQTTVQQKEAPADIPTINLKSGSYSVLDLCKLAGVGESHSQIKRTIEQGGVEIDDHKLTDPLAKPDIKSGSILKFGKRNYFKLQVCN